MLGPKLERSVCASWQHRRVCARSGCRAGGAECVYLGLWLGVSAELAHVGASNHGAVQPRKLRAHPPPSRTLLSYKVHARQEAEHALGALCKLPRHRLRAMQQPENPSPPFHQGAQFRREYKTYSYLGYCANANNEKMDI